MYGLYAVVLVAFAFHGTAIPNDLDSSADTRSRCGPFTPTSIGRRLGQHLSPDSSIYLPTDQQFGKLTDRWSDFSEGDISIVVEPATTRDVAATVSTSQPMLDTHLYPSAIQVKFANDCALPFLVVGQGHGTSSALNTIRRGVSINLQKLRHVHVGRDGKRALIGGGVNTHDVRSTLAAHGKVTSTTNGGCTGLLGPALGGGFGNLLSYFGLILDNIIDMAVVLANGDVLHVSSTSHPDLYWGMRGAGQNFGIVTEATFKIYDMPASVWSVYELDFTDAPTQLEPLFNRFNTITAMPQPKELASLYIYAGINSTYSKTDPILKVQFSYAGTAAQASEWLNRFTDLKPAAIRKYESIPFTQVLSAANADVCSGICQHGSSWRLFPIGLKTYNTTANRQAYDLLKRLVNEHPEFGQSIIQFENYAVGGMKAVDAASTAYPHRNDDILVSFDPIYPRSTVSDAIALDVAQKFRAALHAGDTPGRNFTAYVNYANGDEPIEALYGFFNPFQRG
ncbi:MAG: hypothetical protein LQ350_008139 [Teloschistes chrysophthalmus]|nr:MAG: hypothetical protein LQ350_008139 [Niorma chrysophthalma]